MGSFLRGRIRPRAGDVCAQLAASRVRLLPSSVRQWQAQGAECERQSHSGTDDPRRAFAGREFCAYARQLGCGGCKSGGVFGRRIQGPSYRFPIGFAKVRSDLWERTVWAFSRTGERVREPSAWWGSCTVETAQLGVSSRDRDRKNDGARTTQGGQILFAPAAASS